MGIYHKSHTSLSMEPVMETRGMFPLRDAMALNPSSEWVIPFRQSFLSFVTRPVLFQSCT